MKARELVPEINSQSGRNVLFPYLEGISESEKSALLNGSVDDSMPIEYTVRLILQVRSIPIFWDECRSLS